MIRTCRNYFGGGIYQVVIYSKQVYTCDFTSVSTSRFTLQVVTWMQPCVLQAVEREEKEVHSNSNAANTNTNTLCYKQLKYWFGQASRVICGLLDLDQQLLAVVWSLPEVISNLQ